MNFTDVKYQIFISSTYNDLIEAREATIEAILKLYQIPIGMEMFSAGNAEQWTVISKTIQNSDYYLLIIGQRYGSMTQDDISFTEKEFDYAKSINVPVFAFLRNENVATLPTQRDTETNKQKKLKAFREKVLTNAMVEFWTNESDLAAKVAIALMKMIHETPRVGWVKASNAVSPEVTTELASLSKENRELKLELERYKSIESQRIPNFKLYVNDKESLTIGFMNFGNSYFSQYIVPINENLGTDVTVTDLSSDTPKSTTTHYLTRIHEFNQKIAENKEAVQQYNAAFDRQNRIASNHIKVSFNIENIGGKKANELYVDISFPEEILIFEEIPKRKEIQWPANIPKHPFDVASNAGHLSLLSKHLFFNTSIHIPNTPNFRINGNNLTIKLAELLHTRQKCISEAIYLVPLRIGHFTANVTFMCEELLTPIKSTFEIIVTGNGTIEDSEN